MRKLIVIEFVTLDGVVQAPGGPEEDASGAFAHGGWIRPYADPVQSGVIRKQMSLPFDLLLGRTTFEIWAAYWPQHPDVWPEVQTATKYVASNSLTTHAWGPSVFLSGDVADHVAKLKQQPGPDLHVYGSANLVQTLLKHDLVDAFWLRIHPITLGSGKRLFAGGAIPAAFRVADSQVTSTGVVLVSYERVGAIPTDHGRYLFHTTILQTGNNTGIPVPDDVVAELGAGKRPLVVVSLNGYTYRSAVASMGGTAMIALSAENRVAAGVQGGDEVEVAIRLDLEPRTVQLPQDLRAALVAAGVVDAFEALAPSRKKEDVRNVESAKTDETRERRIAKIVAKLTGA